MYYWTLVKIFGYEVRSASYYPGPPFISLDICICTRECRQKRWMNIDYSIGIAPDKVRCQYAHIPRKDYQVDVILLNQVKNPLLSLGLICMNNCVEGYTTIICN